MTVTSQRVGLAAVATGLLAVVTYADSTAAAAPPDRLAAFGNCVRLVANDVCLRPGNGRLVIWVPDTDPVQFTGDGATLRPASATPVDGGIRYAIDVLAGIDRLSVQSGDSAPLVITLADRERNEDLDRARALIRDGALDEARSLLEAIGGEQDAAHVAGELGRIALMVGETVEARRQLLRAVDAHLAANNRGEGLRDATVLAFLEMNSTRRFDLARQVLGRFEPPPPRHAESRYFLDNFLGNIAYSAGNARGTLTHLGNAARLAQRMGWDRRAFNAQMVLAVQLQHLGRRSEALTLLESWRDRIPERSRACERADYYTNLGWTRLLILETGDPTPDPSADLETAMTLLDEQCPPGMRVNGWINLALASFHAGRLDEAAMHLAAARNETTEPELGMLLWSRDIAARIALARGDAQQALEAYQELDVLASATVSPSARWRAAVGRAAALEALGDTIAALAAYADGADQLDGDIFKVPLDAGRESLLAARDWATRRHIGLAMDAGRMDLAFELTRRVRSRVLRSISPDRATASLSPPARRRWEAALAQYTDVRDAMSEDNALGWTLPSDELERLDQRNRRRGRELRRILDEALAAVDPAVLPREFAPVRAGELLLAFHPVPDGWAAFAQDSAGLVARRSGCPQDPPSAAAACLVALFADAIQTTDTVRFLPVGNLRNVDFHALPFGVDVLAAQVAVTYGVDITADAGGVSTHGTGGGARHAVIVADPRGDLAAARREARSVAERLNKTGGWTFETLAGPAATDRQVKSRLSEAALFHYAGHARFSGPRGWESELALAGDTAFSIADILALESAPETVFLSGCETGRTSDSTPSETIGLANAFLAAGTNTVVAATRPVEDSTAETLVASFYAHWATTTAPKALQRAQLGLREEQPESDWAAFRLVTH